MVTLLLYEYQLDSLLHFVHSRFDEAFIVSQARRGSEIYNYAPLHLGVGSFLLPYIALL